MPPGMKLLFIALAAFSIFHAICCWVGSYTAKPAFRAHFATAGDSRHRMLVLMGSCCVAFLAIAAAWGCGSFDLSAVKLGFPWFAIYL